MEQENNILNETNEEILDEPIQEKKREINF